MDNTQGKTTSWLADRINHAAQATWGSVGSSFSDRIDRCTTVEAGALSLAAGVTAWTVATAIAATIAIPIVTVGVVSGAVRFARGSKKQA